MRAAFASLLLALAACTSSPADSPPPASNGADSLHGYPLRAATSEVRVYSRLDLPFERLVAIAQATRTHMRAWLRSAPAAEGGAGQEPIDVFLCEKSYELRLLESELELPPARYPRLLAHQKDGGYYHVARTVLLVADDERDLAWLLAHEVAHSVFRDEAREHPVVLNEGLAEVVPAWILFCSEPTPEHCHASHPAYAQFIARDLLQGRQPPDLQTFFTQSSKSFQSDRWRNFAFAWSLVKLLVESEEPRLKGRFPRLVAELGRNGDVWADFCAVYDPQVVEGMWYRMLETALGS